MRRLAPAVLLVLWLAAVTGCGDAAGSPADPDAAPPDTTPPDSASAEAAVAVIRDYYAAIAAGDYARAYRHWHGGGAASGQTFEVFRRGFAGTASVEMRRWRIYSAELRECEAGSRP